MYICIWANRGTPEKPQVSSHNAAISAFALALQWTLALNAMESLRQGINGGFMVCFFLSSWGI